MTIQTEEKRAQTRKSETFGGFEPEATGDDNSDKTATHYVTVRKAAGMLDMSQREVRTLAARGRLEMNTEGAASRLEVSLSSVRRLRSEHERAREPGES